MTPAQTRGRTAGHVSYHQWATESEFQRGVFAGTGCRGGLLVIQSAIDTVAIADPADEDGRVSYEVASWTSPEMTSEVALTALIASWNAQTPRGTWIEVTAQPSRQQGDPGPVFVLGRWAETGGDIHRASVIDQASDLARVECDVVLAQPAQTFSSWTISVSLYRRVGSRETPSVSLLGAVVSGPSESPVRSAGSEPRLIPAEPLAVPSYSQMLHRGEYPEFGGGGSAWCSPTSTSMVMDYWQHGPPPASYSWVDGTYADRWVDYAAASTFDEAYHGAGNWTFNTAYAARFGLTAYVTRLRSLTEAERFIHAGIPLVASVSFSRSELTGAGYDTEGHLLVIVGITATGDVVVNDPASHLVASNDEVRAVYARAEFESIWLRSGGVVYVIRPADVPLPAHSGGTPANW